MSTHAQDTLELDIAKKLLYKFVVVHTSGTFELF